MRALTPELKWILRLLRTVASYQIGMFVCIGVASTLAVIDPLILGWLVDRALPGGRVDVLLLVGAMVFATLTGRVVAQGLGGMAAAWAGRNLTVALRTHLMSRLQSLPMSFVETHAVGDMVQRLDRDVDYVSEIGGDLIAGVLRIGLGTVSTLVMMAYLDLVVAMAVIPFVPVFLAVRRAYRARLSRASDDVRAAVSVHSGLLTEIASHVMQIQVLGVEQVLAERYRDAVVAVQTALVRRRRLEIGFTILSLAVVAACTATGLVLGGLRVISGVLTIGALIAFYTYLLRLFDPLSSAIEVLARLHRVTAHIKRLMEIEAHGRPPEPESRVAAPETVAAIHCANVGFRYADAGGGVELITTAFARGERVALVGANGSGKSTLLKLLVRLYEPQRGAIAFDGRGIHDTDARAIRRAVAYVPQEPMLLQGTIRDNLRLVDAHASLAALEHAAHVSHLESTLRRLRRGWDTEIGPFGTGLSGGERQRVALARSVLQNRPIVLLDESLSALDPDAELRILERLADWAASRILIVVTHRLSVEDWATRVLQLHHGRLLDDSALALQPSSGSARPTLVSS